jgi:lipopolysaccharide/colanic/teichoic acid biosynthesis glycosyltransferase
MSKVPIIKRILDLTLTLIAMIVALPVMAVVALLVWIKIGTPVLFKQPRPGFHEKIFTIYKFRTMRDAFDEKGKLLPDDQRLTRFGRILRTTSLDELPELFCVLKGEMSWVGPRPLLMQYLIVIQKNNIAGILFYQNHWLGTSQWSQCDQLGRKIRSGRMVCGSLVYMA